MYGSMAVKLLHAGYHEETNLGLVLTGYTTIRLKADSSWFSIKPSLTTASGLWCIMDYENEWMTCLISGLKGVLSFRLGYHRPLLQLRDHCCLQSFSCSNTTQSLLQSLQKMVWVYCPKPPGFQVAQTVQWTLQGMMSFEGNCHFPLYKLNNSKNMTQLDLLPPSFQHPTFATTRCCYSKTPKRWIFKLKHSSCSACPSIHKLHVLFN